MRRATTEEFPIPDFARKSVNPRPLKARARSAAATAALFSAGFCVGAAGTAPANCCTVHLDNQAEVSPSGQ